MTLTVEVQHPAGAGDPATVELPAEIFDVDANIALIHQVVVAQLAAARQGTHSTKTRAEVRGGGKKPYRQKGTGRARQGSTRAPQFAGGGVVHGPHPHSYEQRTPKKMKAAALRQALSDRARNGRVHVVSALVEGGSPSTRLAAESIVSISTAKHVLVVAGRDDQVSWKSLRNVDAVHVIEPGQLNTYDVLVSDDVVFTQAALEQFVETRGNGATITVTAGEAKPKAAATAPAAKVVEVEAPAVDVAEVQDDDVVDYGPDSHPPIADDEQPEGFPIKGNADSMLYHVPGSAFYDRTVAEVWFTTADAAETAGFELPPSQRPAAETADDADASTDTEGEDA